MARIVIPVTPGTANDESFNVLKDGVPFDLNAAGVTRVDASVCGGRAGLLASGTTLISSTDDDISFLADVMAIIFGRFDLVPGDYFPDIKIFSPTYPAPEGFNLVGKGRDTEILLKVTC